MCYRSLVNEAAFISLFFRTKARDEPGFELTKPSTGQELQHNNKHIGRTIQGSTLGGLQLNEEYYLET